MILRYLLARTANGQLKIVVEDHQATRKELAAARKASRKAAARVVKMTARADKIPPRMLQEARETAEDLESLEKIAHDKVLVTANHVRKVIVEEFPPANHEKLRLRHLPEDSGAGQ